MDTIRLSSLVGASLAILSACGDSATASDAAASGSSGSGGQAGGGGAGGEVSSFACSQGEVPLTQTIGEGTTSFDGFLSPLEGVRACVVSHPSIPCTETEPDGLWEVCLPPSSEVVITYEKEGFMPTLVGIVTGNEPSAVPRARVQPLRPTTAVCDSPWTKFGIACPPTDESLVFVKAVRAEQDSDALPQGLAEVSVEFEPAAGLGPLYEGALGEIDETATATMAPSGNAFAAGLVTPEQIVTLSHPTLATCRGFSFDSWPGPTAGTVRIPTRAGFRTLVPVTCE